MEFFRVFVVGNVVVCIMYIKYDYFLLFFKLFYLKCKVKLLEVIVEEVLVVEVINGDGVFKNCLIVSMLYMYKESFEEWWKNVIRCS